MTDRERDCPREEQAVAWALHALEPDEELEVVAHLPECETCQAAVRDADEVLAGLGASVEQVDPPPALRGSLLARAADAPQRRTIELPRPDADAEQPGEPVAEPRRTGPRGVRGIPWLTSRGRRPAVAALALVAVLAVGGLVVRNAQLQQQRDAEAAHAQSVTDLLGQLARPGTRHALLNTTDGTTVAAVLVTDVRREVVAVGMAPNAAEKSTYVLWGLEAGGNPQALGTFDVAESDAGQHPVGSGGEADRFTSYAISLEPGRVAPASPSEVMAHG